MPREPGVYFHKNKQGKIIYVGKSANLNNRVRQYFQKSRLRDPKTDLLVGEVSDIDYIVVASEAEALFLEAELIRRYRPKYNILLRDDKSLTFVRINIKDQAPTVTITRRPLDDGAEYFGPFLSAGPVRKSLKYLRKIFPYSTHTNLPSRGCLQTHLGLCPGPETASYDRKEYVSNLKKLTWYLKGQRKKVVEELEKEMKQAARQQNYEKAAKMRNQLSALKSLRVQIIFSDRENLDLSKDHALYELTQLLGLKKPPRRIEGFDISHMSGTDTVASMVVFTNGVSDKSSYRKFKMRLAGNDDFAHMNEVLKRRLQPKNIKSWGLPDLILIDGGRGQLSSALKAIDELGHEIPTVGLSKKHEEIVLKKNAADIELDKNFLHQIQGLIADDTADFMNLSLPHSTNLVKLLQRIRDESHRFAVSYHSVLKQNRQTKSTLDDIPGIGPATKKKLLKQFGSKQKVNEATEKELAKVVGSKKAVTLHRYLKAFK